MTFWWSMFASKNLRLTNIYLYISHSKQMFTFTVFKQSQSEIRDKDYELMSDINDAIWLKGSIEVNMKKKFKNLKNRNLEFQKQL